MKTDEVELALLSVSYSRYVSRAHTIFSSFWDIFFGIIVGGTGLVLASMEVGLFELQRLSFFLILIVIMSIMGFVGFVAFYQWYESKMERKTIRNKIRKLITA